MRTVRFNPWYFYVARSIGRVVLTPSIPRSWKIGAAVCYGFFFLYTVIIMQQILIGIALPLFVLAIGYLSWRVWRVFRLYEKRLERETTTESSKEQTEQDTVETLKAEYADGKLSEEEFEAELEQVLADNDTIVERSADGERVETEQSE